MLQIGPKIINSGEVLYFPYFNDFDFTDKDNAFKRPISEYRVSTMNYLYFYQNLHENAFAPQILRGFANSLAKSLTKFLA